MSRLYSKLLICIACAGWPYVIFAQVTDSVGIHPKNIKPQNSISIKINGTIGSAIKKSILPTLNKLESRPGLTITSYEMYIIKDKIVSTFNMTTDDFSDDVKQTIIKLNIGDMILFDKIRVLGPDEQIRTVQNPPAYVIIY